MLMMVALITMGLCRLRSASFGEDDDDDDDVVVDIVNGTSNLSRHRWLDVDDAFVVGIMLSVLGLSLSVLAFLT